MKMLKFAAAALSVATVGGTVGGLLVTDASAGASRTIKVGDNFFVRPGGATVTVRRGTAVTWRWTGSAPHDVAVRRGPVRFRSKVQTHGSYRRRLTKAGVYSIYCTIHGPAMSLKIRVR